jgi:predicted transcriptional regulator
VEKGHLKHRTDGQRCVYVPTRTRAAESKPALQRVVKTFFAGSLADAVAALVDTADGKLPTEELHCIETIIKNAKSK